MPNSAGKDRSISPLVTTKTSDTTRNSEIGRRDEYRRVGVGFKKTCGLATRKIMIMHDEHDQGAERRARLRANETV